jgi:hypothetical protein
MIGGQNDVTPKKILDVVSKRGQTLSRDVCGKTVARKGLTPF